MVDHNRTIVEELIYTYLAEPWHHPGTLDNIVMALLRIFGRYAPAYLEQLSNRVRHWVEEGVFTSFEGVF